MKSGAILFQISQQQANKGGENINMGMKYVGCKKKKLKIESNYMETTGHNEPILGDAY